MTIGLGSMGWRTQVLALQVESKLTPYPNQFCRGNVLPLKNNKYSFELQVLYNPYLIPYKIHVIVDDKIYESVVTDRSRRVGHAFK